MADYLNPADKVAEVGEPTEPTYDGLPSDHVLVGVYDNGVRRIAPVLTPWELERFERRYRAGMFHSRSFFRVPLGEARAMGARL